METPQPPIREPSPSEIIAECRERLTRFDGPDGPDGDRSHFDQKNSLEVARDAGFDSLDQVGDDRNTLGVLDKGVISESEAATLIKENAMIAKEDRERLEAEEHRIMYGDPQPRPKQSKKGGNNRYGDSFKAGIPFGEQ